MDSQRSAKSFNLDELNQERSFEVQNRRATQPRVERWMFDALAYAIAKCVPVRPKERPVKKGKPQSYPLRIPTRMNNGGHQSFAKDSVCLPFSAMLDPNQQASAMPQAANRETPALKDFPCQMTSNTLPDFLLRLNARAPQAQKLTRCQQPIR